MSTPKPPIVSDEELAMIAADPDAGLVSLNQGGRSVRFAKLAAYILDLREQIETFKCVLLVRESALERAEKIAESEADRWRGLNGYYQRVDTAQRILIAIRALIEEAQ